MISRIELSGSWQVSDGLGTEFAGTVPGCVHTDLFTRDEMFFEKNSQNCRFIEERDWTYRKEFVVEELSSFATLCFDGLDTYCEVFLNGVPVGCADNMFIPHKFPLDGVLVKGKNTVEVKFISPVKAVAGKPELIGCFTTERLHTRRMQCTYGWDWVDRFVTVGIYRPAYIVFQNEMELSDVYVFTRSVDKYSAGVKIVEHFSAYREGSIVKTEILDPNGDAVFENNFWCQEEENVILADISDPKIWYPHGYGEQPLYTLRITVGDNVKNQKFGIRTAKILQIKDTDPNVIEKCRALKNTASGLKYDENEEFSCFILLINGTRIFCTGANWVPSEPFPSFETKEKITGILEAAAKAGVNMVRVWGGGIFENEHFYNECDRLGILVTQDFLMACGRYPENEEDFKLQLKREAEFAAVYLRNHPSLVWWSGDNENAVNGDDTMKSYPGRISARSVIAPVLERLDYNRPFLFSSPYGGKKYASKTVGTTHNTQFMGYFFDYISKNDISDYREWWQGLSARFIAEEPNMGAVCHKSLREFISEENLERRDMWLYHTKTNDGLGKELMDITAGFAEGLFGSFGDFEDRYFKLRYVQYEWIRVSLGNARSNAWFNSGIIYWMLNDCWPAAMGWSVLDYYNRPKAGYYALKAHGMGTNVYVTKREGGYRVNLSNVRELSAEAEVKVSIVDFLTGKTELLSKKHITLPSGNTPIDFDVTLKDTEVLIADADVNGKTQRSWYKEGVPHLKKTEKLKWTVKDGGVVISADTYVHAVEILTGHLLEDNYFTVLPGEEKFVKIENEETLKNLSVIGFTF